MALVFGMSPTDFMDPESKAFRNGIEPRLDLITPETLNFRNWVRVIPAFCMVSSLDGKLARFKRQSDDKWEIVIPVFSDPVELLDYPARDRAAWSFALTSSLKLIELFGDAEQTFHPYNLYRWIFGDTFHAFMSVAGFSNQIYLVKYITVNPERLLPDAVFRAMRWVEYEQEKKRINLNPLSYDPITVSRLLAPR